MQRCQGCCVVPACLGLICRRCFLLAGWHLKPVPSRLAGRLWLLTGNDYIQALAIMLTFRFSKAPPKYSILCLGSPAAPPLVGVPCKWPKSAGGPMLGTFILSSHVLMVTFGCVS